MKKNFLETPALWTNAARVSSDPISYASAIEMPTERSNSWLWGIGFIVVILAAVAWFG
jgi:hypothetical protein